MIRSFAPSPRRRASSPLEAAPARDSALKLAPARAPAPAGHDFARIRVSHAEPSAGGTAPVAPPHRATARAFASEPRALSTAAPIQRVVVQKPNAKWHDTDYPDREFDSQVEAQAHSDNQIRVETPHTSTSFDLASLLRGSMEDVDRMAQQVPSASGFEHLNQNDKATGRRGALIQDPQDRARLAQQARQEGGFYSQLFRPGPTGTGTQLGTGRMQSPPFNRTESHVYGSGGEFAPYPTASTEVSSMAREHNVPTQQIFGDLLNTMQGQPPVTPLSQQQLGQLHNTSNIVGIAESHRDPFMSAMSTLELSNASQEPTSTPSQVFGKKKGKTNLQGTMAASGTNAKRSFAIVRESLRGGTDVSESAPRVIRELEKKRKKPSSAEQVQEHADNARERLLNLKGSVSTHLKRTAKMESEKTKRGFNPYPDDPELRREALHMRLKSSLRRDQLGPTGLLPKRLRPLSTPAVGKGPGTPSGSLATEEEMSDWFAEAEERDTRSEEDEEDAGPDLLDLEPSKRLHRNDEDEDEDDGHPTGGGMALAQMTF